MVNFLPIVALLSVSSVLALPAPQTDSAPAAVLVQEAAAAAAADSKVASGTAPYTPVAKRQVPAEPPTAAAVNKSDAQALAAAAVLTAQANQVAAASKAKRQLPMGNTVNVNGGNFKRASESIVLPGSNVVNVNGGNGAPVPAAPAKRQTAPTAPGLGTSGNTINLNGGNAAKRQVPAAPAVPGAPGASGNTINLNGGNTKRQVPAGAAVAQDGTAVVLSQAEVQAAQALAEAGK